MQKAIGYVFYPELERSGKRHSYPVEAGNSYAKPPSPFASHQPSPSQYSNSKEIVCFAALSVAVRPTPRGVSTAYAVSHGRGQHPRVGKSKFYM